VFRNAPILLGIAVAMVTAALSPTNATAVPDPEVEPNAIAAIETRDPFLSPASSVTGRDSVHGAGHNVDATLTVAATSGPLGEDAEGAAHANAPATQVSLRVVCLAVSGGLASVGGVVERSNLLPEGTELIIMIRDTGLPGGEGDGASVLADVPTEADMCPAFVATAALVPPQEHGNWRVLDAAP
jgi:hypothetical protein